LKIREENHLHIENQKPEYLALVLTIEAHFPKNHNSSMYRKPPQRKPKHLQHN